MIVEILGAFIMALYLEMMACLSRYFKSLIILVASITIIITYFTIGWNFIAEIDFSILLLFVIVFDEILMHLPRIVKRRILK